MAELELTRSGEDRRLYLLEGVGTLRLEGWLGRRATAEAGSARWQLARAGVLRTKVTALDERGQTAGEFDPRSIRRGGSLRWGSEDYELRPASAWRERYALVAGERELVVLEAKGWGKRPVRVSVEEGTGLDPGLVLFAVFVVRGLAEDTAAIAGSTTAATSGATTS